MKPLPNKNMTLAELDAYIEERRKQDPEVTPFEAFQDAKHISELTSEPLTEEEKALSQKLFNDWVSGYEKRASFRSGIWGLIYVFIFIAIMLWWTGPAKCVP